MGHEKASVRLREAIQDDWSLLLRWRNDPGTRRGSNQTGAVTEERHREWLAACLADGDRRLWIAEVSGVAVGSVRADHIAGEQVLSWTVAPEARGKGIGRAMVTAAVAQLNGPLCAHVKVDNAASRAIAKAVGLQPDGESDGLATYRRPT